MSTGQLKTEHTRTQQFHHHNSIESHTEQSEESISTGHRQPISIKVPQVPLSSAPSSKDSTSVSSTGKRQDALDIFEQYGITRPKGWLSRGLSEVGVEAVGQPSDSRANIEQVCHSCGANLNSRQYCSHCGHDSCVKCTSEVPDGDTQGRHFDNTQGAHEGFEEPSKYSHHADEVVHVHTQTTRTTTNMHTVRHRENSSSSSGGETPQTRSPTKQEYTRVEKALINSKSRGGRQGFSTGVRNHPFLVADREGQAQATEPQSKKRVVRVDEPTQLSDCIPSRIPPRQVQAQLSSDDSSQSQRKCSNPSCRATHAGHHPFRHSISCAAHRKAKPRTDSDTEVGMESQSHKPPRSPLGKKIDQLYQHAEDLHNSQHVMEHLASGSRHLNKDKTSQQGQADTRSRSWKRHTIMRIPERPPEDTGPLAHGTRVLVDDDIGTQSPSSSVESTDVTGKGNHNLAADPMVERGVSPKSHDLPGDIRTYVTSWKPHSISQDPRFEVQKRLVQPSRQSFPPPNAFSSTLRLGRPDQLLGPTLKQLKNSEAHIIPHLRKTSALKVESPATNATVEPDWLSSRTKDHLHQGARRVLEQHPHSFHGQKSLQSLHEQRSPSIERTHFKRGPGSRSEKATETVPWKQQSLRRVSKITARGGEADSVPDISTWRQQLRKVERPEDRTQAKTTTPPVVRWRRSLSKLPQTPQPDAEKEHSCKHCNPSESSSLQHRETSPEQIGYDELMGTGTHNHQYLMAEGNQPVEYKSTPSRLKLRQIEHSLAFKNPSDFTDEFQSYDMDTLETREVESKQYQTKSHSSFEEPIAKIHNPQPVTSTDHVCAWRTRFIDLSTEVEHLKSEMSSRQGLYRGAQGRQSDSRLGTAAKAHHECSDIDIEGLTIVMHMRGKDDLVINTDLTKE